MKQMYRIQTLETKETKFVDIFPNFNDQAKDIICPFVISQGAVNNTEAGDFTENVRPTDFKSFRKLYTGQEQLIAKWKNSSKAEIDENEKVEKRYTIGDNFRALEITGALAGVNFTPTTIGDNKNITIEQQDTQQRTFIVNADDYTFTRDSLYELHAIPTGDTQELFYILSLFSFRDPVTRKVIYYEITFSTIDNILANSGAAVEQFIGFGAWGEGYAYPKVIDNEIQLDEDKLKNRPIDEIQLDLFGNSLICSIGFTGRRTKIEDNEITPPRHIFPYKPQTPESFNTIEASQSESSFYFIQNSQVELEGYYNTWKEQISSQYDNTATRNYDGAIATNKSQVIGTNTDYKNIFDDTFLIPIDTTNGANVYDTEATPYADKTITLPENMSFHNLNLMNYIIYNDTEYLPVGINASTIYRIKDLGILGMFLNVLFLGIPIGWKNNNVSIPAKKLNFFSTTTSYDFLANEIDEASVGGLFLDAYRTGTEDTIGGVLGLNNQATSIRFRLSDVISKDDELKNTLYLAQEKDKGGFTLQGNEILAPAVKDESFDGFIIDNFNIKAILKGNYKITAFSGGVKVHQAIYQSRAKFTNSIREWSNTIKLSDWKNDDGKYVSFPEEIQKPSPEITKTLDMKKPQDIAIPNAFNGGSGNWLSTISSGVTQIREKEQTSTATTILADYGYTWESLKEAGFEYIDIVPDANITATGENINQKSLVRIQLNDLDENYKDVEIYKTGKEVYAGYTFKYYVSFCSQRTIRTETTAIAELSAKIRRENNNIVIETYHKAQYRDEEFTASNTACAKPEAIDGASARTRIVSATIIKPDTEEQKNVSCETSKK